MPYITRVVADALDPGENHDFPNFPRDLDGRPLWTDDPAHTAFAVFTINGQRIVVTGRHRGLRRHRDVTIDVTPYGPDGQPIDPPVIAGWQPGAGSR